MAAEEQLMCELCRELKSPTTNPHFATGNADSFVCSSCVVDHIIPKFNEAFQNPDSYPPTWGDQGTIEIARFEDMLDPRFVADYREKEVEFKARKQMEKNTPKANRIFCPHTIHSGGQTLSGDVINVFANGNAHNFPTETCNAFAGTDQNEEGEVICGRCKGITCTKCRTPLTQDLKAQHVCPEPDPSKLSAAEEEELAFRDLSKGVFYQVCPYCDTKVELIEACNDMLCICKEHFCYICGEGVPPEERHIHWRDSCPRYGHPSTATRDHFDPPAGEDDAAAALAEDMVVPFDEAPTATPEQEQEAYLAAVGDEVDDPLGLREFDPQQPPPTYGIHLGLVMDRDVLVQALEDLDIDGPMPAGSTARQGAERFALSNALSSVLENMERIGGVLRLSLDEIPSYLTRFEDNLAHIQDSLGRVALNFLLEDSEVRDIVEHRHADVQQLIARMRTLLQEAVNIGIDPNARAVLRHFPRREED